MNAQITSMHASTSSSWQTSTVECMYRNGIETSLGRDATASDLQGVRVGARVAA